MREVERGPQLLRGGEGRQISKHRQANGVVIRNVNVGLSLLIRD
jgi:hypothetical protein